jgi:hypothetical protein
MRSEGEAPGGEAGEVGEAPLPAPPALPLDRCNGDAGGVELASEKVDKFGVSEVPDTADAGSLPVGDLGWGRAEVEGEDGDLGLADDDALESGEPEVGDVDEAVVAPAVGDPIFSVIEVLSFLAGGLPPEDEEEEEEEEEEACAPLRLTAASKSMSSSPFFTRSINSSSRFVGLRCAALPSAEDEEEVEADGAGAAAEAEVEAAAEAEAEAEAAVSGGAGVRSGSSSDSK